ncbi:MAG TPA: cation transporter, partial [Reyranella sp.]|nr:cation transporter [Reyranella sp.]
MPFTAGSFLLRNKTPILPQCSRFETPAARSVLAFARLHGKSRIRSTLLQSLLPMSAILYALGANAGIAASKGVAAALTGSSSMLAEAVHSSADCANQLLLLLGLKQAKREPTPDHPLGFGKA